MLIFYSVVDALVTIRKEIEELEDRLDKETDPYHKESLRTLIGHKVYQGIIVIKATNPSEVSEFVVDYFLNRTSIRPDICRLEKEIEKSESKKNKKKKSL